MATQKDYFADEIGTLKLDKEPKGKILAGDVGYLITGIKQAKEVKVGDTITDAIESTKTAIDGFEEVKPMVLQVFILLILKILRSYEVQWKNLMMLRLYFRLKARLHWVLVFVAVF